MKNRICLYCRKASIRLKHLNAKYCDRCRVTLLKRPKSNLSIEQKNQVKLLIGKMPREDIAAELGCSLSALKRAFRGTRLAYYNYCVINPDFVQNVSSYYEKHGNIKTSEHFGIKRKQVEHIVYRYKLAKPRQTRWTNEQFINLVKMGGLVSPRKQAKIFSRPGANIGSIKSAWSKKINIAPGQIHGMKFNQAKHLVNKDATYIKNYSGHYICLWVDMEKYLQKDCPQFIQDAIHSMAEFQRWLFGKSPKRSIMKIIRNKSI